MPFTISIRSPTRCLPYTPTALAGLLPPVIGAGRTRDTGRRALPDPAAIPS